MPWKVDAVSELRFALCHAVRSLHRPVAAAAREFGVSRKTAHKWLGVFDASPARTDQQIERLVLDVRDRFNWGPRKIHAFLLQQAARDTLPPPQLPSVR